MCSSYSRRVRPRLVAGLAACAMVSMLLAGCAKSAPPVPPSLELVKPVRDLTAVRTGNKVLLRFTLTNEATDGGGFRAWGPVRICRSQAVNVPVTECSEVAAALRAEDLGIKEHDKTSQKVAVSYEDTLPPAWQVAGGEAAYAVELVNRFQRSAGLGNVVRVPTAATLAAPLGLRAEVVPSGVALTWQPVEPSAAPGASYEYRVERYAQSAEEPGALACKVPLGSAPSCTDANMPWERPLEYTVRVVTLLPDRQVVLGDASARLPMLAHDVYPPAVPQGVQAVASGTGQAPFVDLTWTPATDADLGGYNIYRREEGGQWTKLNAALVALPSYRDSAVSAGHRYAYAVTAVDVRGNESAKSEEATESVP